MSTGTTSRVHRAGRHRDSRGAPADGARVIAARVIAQLVGAGRSLASVLPAALAQAAERERSLLQELCYGVARWYPQLSWLLDRLLDKPLQPQEHAVKALLLVGLYQLIHLRVPDHAAIAETVAASANLRKNWAAGLINAVLRQFQRRRADWLAAIAQDEIASTAHPAWLLRRLQADWPADWPTLVDADNERPPLCLRVNPRRSSRAAYVERLRAGGLDAQPSEVVDTALTLTHACDVEALPGFGEGLISVQDSAGQLAAGLLDLHPGMRVLDACAAPGGKTCHILETQPRLDHVLALDEDAARLAQVSANLERLGLGARLACGDAGAPATWWDGLPYHRILVDAPCSATGVIRRHPDIKVLRRADDIDPLARRQRVLLDALWPLLAPDGLLLYATCSVLKRENEDVVADFLATHPDARERPLASAWGRAVRHGRQILSGQAGMDGFYYAVLVKQG